MKCIEIDSIRNAPGATATPSPCAVFRQTKLANFEFACFTFRAFALATALRTKQTLAVAIVVAAARVVQINGTKATSQQNFICTSFA